MVKFTNMKFWIFFIFFCIWKPIFLDLLKKKLNLTPLVVRTHHVVSTITSHKFLPHPKDWSFQEKKSFSLRRVVSLNFCLLLLVDHLKRDCMQKLKKIGLIPSPPSPLDPFTCYCQRTGSVTRSSSILCNFISTRWNWTPAIFARQSV